MIFTVEPVRLWIVRCWLQLAFQINIFLECYNWKHTIADILYPSLVRLECSLSLLFVFEASLKDLAKQESQHKEGSRAVAAGALRRRSGMTRASRTKTSQRLHSCLFDPEGVGGGAGVECRRQTLEGLFSVASAPNNNGCIDAEFLIQRRILQHFRYLL